jgi:hypothetical protein
LQNSIGTVSDGTFAGAHRDGDVLLMVDFQGNRDEEKVYVSAYAWKSGAPNNIQTLIAPSETDFRCSDATPVICAISNSVAITSGMPFTNNQNTYTALKSTFIEGGINFKQLFPNRATPCFVGFLMETRSSNVLTSELQDFVAASLYTCNFGASAVCGQVAEGAYPYMATATVTVINNGASTQSVSRIEVTNLPQGATVAFTLPQDASVAPGQTKDFTVSIRNLPRQGFEPDFLVSFTGGAQPVHATACCPAPPPLTFSVSRTCGKRSSGLIFDYPNGFIYTISGTVMATGGSLRCSYTDNSALVAPASPFTVVVGTPFLFTYQVEGANNFIPNPAAITCTDLRGGDLGATDLSVSSAACPAYTHSFTVTKACANGVQATGKFSYDITVAVTNSGTGSLFNCQLNDPSVGIISPPVRSATAVAPGGSLTFRYTISQTSGQQTTIGELADLGVSVTCDTASGSHLTSQSARLKNLIMQNESKIMVRNVSILGA